MSNDDPITVWLEDLKNGEEAAARKIWNHFVGQLTISARNMLRPDTRRVYDEDDAAQSAFNSLCAGIAAGRFPDLNDRNSLWRLMLVITSRKVSHRHRYDGQERRDVRRNVTDSVFIVGKENTDKVVDQLVSHEPTPEFTAEFADTCDALFDMLDDEMLRKVGWLKFEGFRDDEIAEKLGCARRTVQRKVEIIRRTWSEQLDADL